MHDSEDLPFVDFLRIESDKARSGSQVDHGGGNGVVIQQRLFQAGHAGGAMQTLDPEGQLSGRLGTNYAIAQGLDFYGYVVSGDGLLVEVGSQLSRGEVNHCAL